MANCFGLWRRGSNALFQRSSLLQQLICHVEAGPEGARSDMQLFEARDTFHRATRRMTHCLFEIALRRWGCSCSSRCECVSVSTSVSSVVRIVYFTTYKFWTGRSVEVIPVSAQMRARGSSVLRALFLTIHVHLGHVFVLTLFRRVRTVYKGLCVVRA